MKYAVVVEQWIREVAIVEVEADSPAQAVDMAYDADEYDWTDGDDSTCMQAISVSDPVKQKTLWRWSKVKTA